MKLSIIIPVFNEQITLPKILSRVLLALREIDKEIIIVDDGSTDGSRNWLFENIGVGRKTAFLSADQHGDLLFEKYDSQSSADNKTPVTVILHENNKGKGAALRSAFKVVENDIITIQDADLEYDPRDLNQMWELIDDDLADVVYGSRFQGKSHHVMKLHHYLANRLISLFTSILCNIQLTDIETCYKMFRREVIENMRLRSNDFGIEVELTMNIALAQNWRIYETAIRYNGRDIVGGKKINWRDGVKALWYIILFRFRR